LSNLSSDNKIKGEKEINKFKKISNVKKLKEYKRLLTLILKESLNYVMRTREINNKIEVDQVKKRKSLKDRDLC